MKYLFVTCWVTLLSFNILFADNLNENSSIYSNFNKKEAKELYYNGNYKEAIDYLDKLIEMSPSDYELYALCGDCHKQEGNYEQALEDTMKSLDINKNAPAYMTLIELSGEKLNPVLDRLNEMGNEQPEESKWYYYLGKVYYHNDDFELAMKAFEKAYSIDKEPIYITLIEDCRNKLSE